MSSATSSSDEGLLRFITCGSVDDGKSTLIGRLLYEAKTLAEDQLAAVAADSRRWGTQGERIDFALLVDGLAAEREQGITIDVAYRYFATEKRKFIVADTPGHEQYTRNMITGASTADLAVILVDARKGVLTQTRRHSTLVSLIGIRQVVLAVNKMDLVGYDEARFASIVAEYRAFAERIGLADIRAIPLSALEGDTITRHGDNMPWYRGPTLMQVLERTELDHQRALRQPLRLPVQWVNRPNADFRGYCGQLAGGTLHVGQRVRVQPSGRETTIERIVALDGDRASAIAGESVTITLDDDVDVSRGDLISAADDAAEVAEQFEAHLVWMAEAPMQPGRPYLIKIGTRTVTVNFAEPKYKFNVNTLEHLAARELQLNEIGVCSLTVDRALPFDPYTANRTTGGFIVIDRISHETVGAGMLQFALRRARHVQPQAYAVGPQARAQAKGQRATVLWLTGLSGAGKSTIAAELETQLQAQGRHAFVLDGDNLRHGLNSDLGFSVADRGENIRRTAEVARLMADAGLIVIVALISPLRADRERARQRFAADEFVEVFVDAPLAVAEARDVKGLYRKARSGELKGFTGIDSPYEAPLSPELHLSTDGSDPGACADRVLQHLREGGRIG